MNKVKKTLEIVFFGIIFFMITMGIYLGYKHYNNKDEVESETSSGEEEDLLHIITDIEEINNLSVDLNHISNADVYNMNYNLLRKMISRGDVAILRKRTKRDLKIILFNSSYLQKMRSLEIGQTEIILEDLKKVYALEFTPTGMLQLKNIFFKENIEDFMTKQLELNTDKKLIDLYMLNRFFEDFFCYKQSNEHLGRMVYFYADESHIKCMVFNKTKLMNEWMLWEISFFAIPAGLDVDALMVYLICSYIHPIKLDERNSQDI